MDEEARVSFRQTRHPTTKIGPKGPVGERIQGKEMSNDEEGKPVASPTKRMTLHRNSQPVAGLCAAQTSYTHKTYTIQEPKLTGRKRGHGAGNKQASSK